MDRVANHLTNKVTDVYDHHGYAEGRQADHGDRGAARLEHRRGDRDEQCGQLEVTRVRFVLSSLPPMATMSPVVSFMHQLILPRWFRREHDMAAALITAPVSVAFSAR